MDKKICLIVNVKNGEKYLDICLDSLCSQEYTSFKIFVFDNLSVDRTPLIVEKYQKKYSGLVEHVLLPHEMSINYGRNYALEYLVRSFPGEFSHFSFCDSDDFWALDWLSSAQPFLDHKSVIYTDGYEIIENEYWPVYVDHQVPKYSFLSGRVYLQGTIIPFTYVDAADFFDVNVMYCIDVDKWNQFYDAGVPFVHLNKKLFYYRILSTSLSATGFNRVMKERLYLTKKYKRSKVLYVLKFAFYYIKHKVFL